MLPLEVQTPRLASGDVSSCDMDSEGETEGSTVMVGVAEMLTFAFGFWVGTGVGVTLDFFITDTIKSQSEAAGDSGVVSYQT